MELGVEEFVRFVGPPPTLIYTDIDSSIDKNNKFESLNPRTYAEVLGNQRDRTNFSMQRRMEVYKIDGDPAATDAHDAQVPDAPVRPTVAENATADKGEQDLPPED